MVKTGATAIGGITAGATATGTYFALNPTEKVVEKTIEKVVDLNEINDKKVLVKKLMERAQTAQTLTPDEITFYKKHLQMEYTPWDSKTIKLPEYINVEQLAKDYVDLYTE